MVNEWVDTKIYIVVKTYPNSSRKYQETVCTAGITEGGEWIRLYPIQFRQMEKEKQFKKYTWVKTRIKRANDHRTDSYHPDMNHFEVLETHKTSGRGNWDRRKQIVYPTRSQSIEELQERYRLEKRSLGIFRPLVVSDFIIKRNDKSNRANQPRDVQMNLFHDPSKPLENIPYEFRYEFKCNDNNCKGHSMIVLDWEIYQAFREWRDIYGSEHEALLKIKEKWFETMCGSDRDTHFIVGTHNRFPRFMVLGTFYPKIEDQMSIYDLYDT